MNITANRVTRLSEDDLGALCEAATAAILGGGGFGWLEPPPRNVLERYFQGLLLVPEASLFIVRESGVIQGAAVLTRPSRHNEVQAMSAHISGFHVAPYMRGRGLGHALLADVVDYARGTGCRVLNCDIRETQSQAIALFRTFGFEEWGTHPYYARVHGETVRGLYLVKLLDADGALNRETHATTGKDTASVTQLRRDGLMLYPAIDLKGGACVRLRRGDMEDATHYSDDPAAQARSFVDAGCRHLHVVDLDGAFAGQSANIDAVKAIVKVSSVPVQLGGGIRDIAAIERWLDAGVARVILGSVAVKNPDLVRQASRAFPGRIVAGIDARDGRVATEGWAEISDITAIDLACRMEDAGVAAIIFTEISRDGMLEGLDLEQTSALADAVSLPVIASGGVGSVTHLQALRSVARRSPGIRGVIVGRAIYDGRVSVQEALAALEVA